MKKKQLYLNGKIDEIERIIIYCEKQIAALKKINPQPNSPKQIHNGGQLKAFNKILSALKSMKQKLSKK